MNRILPHAAAALVALLITTAGFVALGATPREPAAVVTVLPTLA